MGFINDIGFLDHTVTKAEYERRTAQAGHPLSWPPNHYGGTGATAGRGQKPKGTRAFPRATSLGELPRGTRRAA